MEETRRVYFSKLHAHHDIKLLFAGSMVGGESSGSRPYYLLHYITHGTGSITIDGTTLELTPGDFFIHHPNRSMTYRATQETPWTYYWMALDGPWIHDWIASLVPDETHPICRGAYDPDIKTLFERLLVALSRHSMADVLESEAVMRLILSSLLSRSGRDSDASRASTPVLTVQHAQHFMLTHYAEPITVADVCSVTGYERTYFSNLFHQQTGQTMQEYLRSVRLTQACSLLTTTELTVSAVAERVGFAEYRSFSRCFRKAMNRSPQQYRKEHAKRPAGRS